MYVSRVATEWATALKEGNFPLAPSPSGGSENVSTAIQEGGYFMFSKKERIQLTQICVLISKSFVYLACEILSHFRFRSSAGDLPCILFSVQWTKEGYREVVVGRSSSKTFPSYISSASCQYQHQVSAS